jgi:hypothetical protein
MCGSIDNSMSCTKSLNPLNIEETQISAAIPVVMPK